MRVTRTFTHRLLVAESKFGRTGAFPQFRKIEPILRARFVEANARKGEALLHLGKVPELLRARALASRGELEAARRSLAQAGNETADTDTLAQTEIFFEKARLASFRGSWLQTAEQCRTLRELKPAALTLLSALQVEALAQFELQNFSEALALLRQAESLREIFPHAASGFYSEVLSLRLLARQRPLEEALEKTAQLWRSRSSGPGFNADHVLTLIRLGIDLKRLAGLDYSVEAAAAQRIAALIGDRLYQDLARLDFELATGPASAASPSDFERVERLRREILEIEAPSTTAIAMMLPRKPAGPTLPLAGPVALALTTDAQFLLVSGAKAVVSLAPWKVHSLAAHPQHARALGAFAGRPRWKKSELFTELWGLSRYSPRAHDGLLWTLASRLKKKYGLKITLSNGEIECAGLLAIAISTG